MSHNIGRIVAIPEVRIGPDSGAPSTSPGIWETSFVPEPALVGGTPRFVVLHLTSLDLPGASRVEVELGYDVDVRAPDVEGDPADAFLATLRRIAAESGGELPIQRSSVTVQLHDDGAHDDGAMDRDGVYGNPTDDLLRFEGTYTLHAVATYGDGCRGRREAMWSVHVEPGIDPERTGIEVVETGDAPDGGRSGTIRTPHATATATPSGRGGAGGSASRHSRARASPGPWPTTATAPMAFRWPGIPPRAAPVSSSRSRSGTRFRSPRRGDRHGGAVRGCSGCSRRWSCCWWRCSSSSW